MRRFTRTIIMLVAFSQATASPGLVQGPERKIQTFTISGNAGMSGVTMKGPPGTLVTDEKGYYIATVENGWSGMVMPAKEGCIFEPASRTYQNVNAPQTNHDYAPKIITYTISGQVGIPGVVMQGLPGNPVTDERGYYTSTLAYGWSGTVKPVKEGYKFKPAGNIYQEVSANQNNQNYTAEQILRKVWQFEGGRWEPMREGVDGRGSRQTRRSTGYSSAIAPTAGRNVLVVPAEEVKAQDLAEIMEDMQVMSLILDERFKETRRVQGVFTDFGDFFGRDNRQTEATYLQGYGVLFSMEVNFAFSPPTKPQGQEAEQTSENVDSTWQQARRQMFSPGDSRRPGGAGSSEEYNSQMVEELKRDLITTLKHAANIRGVQTDELVILTVIGGGRQSRGVYGGGGYMMGSMGGSSASSGGGMMGGGMGGMMGGGMGGGMMGGGMGGGMMGGGMGGMSGMGVSPATVLTIRTKKSDVDAFAGGQQDFEQFRRKVQIFTY